MGLHLCHSPHCSALNTRFSLCVVSWILVLNSNYRNLFERGKDGPHVFRGLVSCCHLAALLYSSQSAMDIDFWPSASRKVTSFLWFSRLTGTLMVHFLQKYIQVLQNWWRLWLQIFLWDVFFLNIVWGFFSYFILAWGFLNKLCATPDIYFKKSWQHEIVSLWWPIHQKHSFRPEIQSLILEKNNYLESIKSIFLSLTKGFI